MTFLPTRALLRRWLWRREVLPFLPALLLAGTWIGGEGVLIAAAVLFPALHALLGRTPDGVSVRDALTGLPLRAEVERALDRAIEAAPRDGSASAALAIGLDGLPALEARLGAEAAAEVERRVARRIAATLRRDDAVARLGPGLYGAALAPVGRADLETALRIAERIQAAVRAPLALEPERAHVTCSIGLCLTSRAPRPSGGATIEAALAALAEARSGGPESVRSYSGRRFRPAAAPGARSAEAVAALEAGQIRPWFQPQLSTATGQISGFEALARWEHPDRGPLAPAAFLEPLAAAGKLDRLGEVIREQGFAALRAWDEAGFAVPSLGVNFSGAELRDPHLADKIAWDLDRFDLAPARLTAEILESVLVESGDDTIPRSIAALARLGCRIDLDDFGTGNASMAALRRFSVGRIKIDRSFVTGIDENPEQRRLVAALLGFAERLGLDTLAEGVERVAEHSALAQLGCGHVQGYGIARPMPFKETLSWMSRYTERLAEGMAPGRRAI